MFDYFSIINRTENATFAVILFTIVLAFLLASILVFTYEKTSRGISRPDHFLQSMILIAIVASTVMQAIGDSLARGLGMMGALSIIRFRTTIRDSRNIVFMFASLAVGIACGVYGFLIAVIGTIGFSLTAFLLRFSSYSHPNNLVAYLKFDTLENEGSRENLRPLFKKYCKRYEVARYKISTNDMGENVVSYEYELKLEKQEQGIALAKAIMALPNIRGVKFDVKDTPELI